MACDVKSSVPCPATLEALKTNCPPVHAKVTEALSAGVDWFSIVTAIVSHFGDIQAIIASIQALIAKLTPTPATK